MDYLARRDHSEKELREKLSKKFSEDEIETAILYAKENNWMIHPHELSEKVAASLGEKGKGIIYIQQYLNKKGLPSVTANYNYELTKAERLLESLMKKRKDEDAQKWREKTQRYLVNRGYDSSTIREVIKQIDF